MASMNRLARERSPYLLQHAANPVDWYPWGDEAFERARRENKPIFLSIGYSTCHWCHVMEHESFENQAIADVLNADFVSIKVDREERPDVDRVYMSFVQSTTGCGGWPMSVFLTPELKPFFGGTYFPPSSRWGRPGFLDVLGELTRVWQEDRARVDYAAAELFDRLRATTGTDGRSQAETTLAGTDALTEAVEQYPTDVRSASRWIRRRAEIPAPLRVAAPAARARPHGILTGADHGDRDPAGDGPWRHARPRRWRIPSILRRRGMARSALREDALRPGAARARLRRGGTGGRRSVLLCGRRGHPGLRAARLRDPQGGFYSAEDADSLVPGGDHKREGAFYVWSDEEIGSLLGDEADVVRKRFGIEPGGNAPQDPQGEFTGQNLLYTAQSIEDISVRSGKTASMIVETLGRARQTLFDARGTRPRPHLDDKVITSWNGLMIAAFARASRVLVTRPDAGVWLDTARQAADFIRTHLWSDSTGRLQRRFRDGEAAIDAYAEDYACLIWGVLELFQADGDSRWLAWARQLQASQDTLFWDEVDAGWFSTTGTDPSVLLRLKEDYDGAEPSASSVSVLNALTLAHLTNDRRPDEGGANARPLRSAGRAGGPRDSADAGRPLDVVRRRDSDRRDRASRP